MAERPAKRSRRVRSEASPSPDRVTDAFKLPASQPKPQGDKSQGEQLIAPRAQPRMEQLTKSEWFEKYRLKELADAEVFYKANWVDSKTANAWLKELNELSEWYRPKLKVYGRDITQSREIAAYSTSPILTLKYSGHPVEIHSPFPRLLQEIADRLSNEDCLGNEVGFNHCMLNRYQSGAIHLGKHHDNLENKVIVTVSLGAARTFILERKKPRGSKQATLSARGPADTPSPKLKSSYDSDSQHKKIILGNGSLLVMQGYTQHNYTHEIPKERRIKDPRISITFRQLIN
ncbi:hypothetical protein K437DRAFT_259223 [Tilletiaria anomala UBC 951]|uniref:Fe2OG dioxygenase domain-containing protein n=1 Tax=Tilletiaria anomala (strain ATCC 24038 / CBS 436.72 / UBC 951) TaxID=1037660 RepID=A0A066VKA6_TILAU|nr:uncharacterized protein K437DRAFT_259223 [Tilletiaria anomala UBC 951]KDN39020.1 hypothetical protein K437DRAFT_259223 [Tilletiaria anomala UBC 951]